MYCYPFFWPAFTNQVTCQPPSRKLHCLHQPLYTGSLLAAVVSSYHVGRHRHSQNTVTSCSANNLQGKDFCLLNPTANNKVNVLVWFFGNTINVQSACGACGLCFKSYAVQNIFLNILLNWIYLTFPPDKEPIESVCKGETTGVWVNHPSSTFKLTNQIFFC